MKIQIRVSALICTSFLIAMSGCQGYRPTTSYFGHGVYHCYYQNVQSHVLYQRRADTEASAARMARAACPGDCRFVDCIFK